MNWIALTSIDELDKIKTSTTPVIIFKHSTRCPISSMAKRTFELEAALLPQHVSAYYLDLIKYREISNQVAERWDVRHESPQALLIHNNQCLYNASHGDIEMAELVNAINGATS